MNMDQYILYMIRLGCVHDFFSLTLFCKYILSDYHHIVLEVINRIVVQIPAFIKMFPVTVCEFYLFFYFTPK